MKPQRVILFLILTFAILPVTCQKTAGTGQEDGAVARARALIDSNVHDYSRLPKAMAILQKELKQNPQNTLAYVQLARVEIKMGYINRDNYQPESLDRADGLLDEALKIDPECEQAFIARGYIRLFQKDLAEARKMADRAMELRDKYDWANLLSALIDKYEKNYTQALAKVEWAIENAADPECKRQAESALPILCQLTEDYEKADQVYRTQIQKDPDNPWDRINYASFLQRRKRYNEAIAEGEKALKLMDFGMAHHVLSRAYYDKGCALLWDLGKPMEAGEYFEKSIERDPGFASAYYGLGIQVRYVARKKHDRKLLDLAKSYLETALKLNPNDKAAKFELSRHDVFVKQVEEGK